MKPLDLTSADGTRLRAYRWEPDAPPTADVLLVHGLAEHMGRYGHVADALVARGWRVTGVELRGHGHSGGKRGHVDSWARYTEDLDAAAATIDGRFAVLAHSMGGLVTLDWLRDREHRVVALAASAPFLGTSVEAPRWKVAAARVLSRLTPRLSMANEIPSVHVCSDPEVVAAYDADPLVYATVTPRWFRESQKAVDRVLEHAPRYRTPLYLFWGTGERIVSVGGLEALARGWGGPVETHAWPGLYHETMNERVRDDVVGKATRFLAERLPTSAQASA